MSARAPIGRPFDLVRATVGGPALDPPAPVHLEVAVAPGVARFGPYVLSEELATAVNVALTLDQPLLVTGEPGCGKTSLAWAVAAQLGTRVLEFHTKSTSAARDVLYTFDTLRRFHDASVGLEEARDPARYVSYQALGEAVRADATMVVLIDEIDKAPRDFPNDLLNELDGKEFTVAEVTPPARFRQKARHFVLITSNSERRLPHPFLRRCAYAHIPFPDEAMLARIVALHTAHLAPAPSFLNLVVARFLELRRVERLVKPPATGELIGWMRVLQRLGVSEEDLRALPLARTPALESMLKTLEDVRLVRDQR